MFQQLLTPVAGSLLLSFIVAVLPIVTVLYALGVARRPAWQASLMGVVVGLIVAILVWRFPVGLALDAFAAGAVFALWPVMWIVWNALFLYNIAVRSGKFDLFRRWMLHNIPADRRILLIVIGFSFGALMEGIAGFGTPVAITSSLLIALGFPALEALTFTLIFNTAPVAFGALGVPITVLASVTHLPDTALASMVGRQLPVMALILPFYVMVLYGGLRSLREVWPAALVAGLSFALTQYTVSNHLNYSLTDVLSSLVSLLVMVLFLRVWKPAHSEQYQVKLEHLETDGTNHQATTLREGLLGWAPWLVVSAVVILWTFAKINLIGDTKIPWPGLDKAVFITLYKTPYAAIWDFQPLATGTAILLSALLTALVVGAKGSDLLGALGDTWRQLRLAILTVALIVGLAYLLNYSGINYTLGLAVASVGAIFPLLSAFLGWVAVFLSGSDTSGNALFGNLQVVAAKQLNLNPILMAATNSSGGVMGKMISPQNISTGVSTTGLVGKEGLVLARTFRHSIILTLILGVLVLLQQYVFPGVIPRP